MGKDTASLFTGNPEFVREIQHIWRMLQFGQIKNEFHWLFICFRKVSCGRTHSVTQFHCLQESKNHNIILICAHMAQNPYFPAPCKMCLMGDIQVGMYFSKSIDVHLLQRGIRILSDALFETLNLH